MIGNDIIDLTLAQTESNWKRRGYLEKIFTTKEQNQILSSKDPELTLWLFWSMKEAVYKIVHRETKTRFYNPKKFYSEIISKSNIIYMGSVFYENQIFRTKSTVASNTSIHTIASNTLDNLNSISSIVKESSKYSSSQNLIDAYFKKKTLKLYKDNNQIPYLIDIKTTKKQPISISHHGDFISLASFNNSVITR